MFCDSGVEGEGVHGRGMTRWLLGELQGHGGITELLPCILHLKVISTDQQFQQLLEAPLPHTLDTVFCLDL